ncbi:MAG: hypothetical protein ACT4PU_04735 [Planctomycetota bacterium]
MSLSIAVGRASRLALVAVYGLAQFCAGCDGSGAASATRNGTAQASPDRVLLIASRSFDGSDRIAHVLNDMFEATDVLGDSRVELLDLGGASPEQWGPVVTRRLAADPPLRAAVLLVGDLSLFDNLEPAQRDRVPDRLIRREFDEALLAGTLGELARQAAKFGVPWHLATAPLGHQGRVEVPELAELAEALRLRGLAFDFARDFRSLEQASLFGNGLDRLDAYGHDELARLLFQAACGELGALPARDSRERRARLQARTLEAWRTARDQEFRELAGQVLAEDQAAAAAQPGDSAARCREAGRVAAIASARNGWAAEAGRWSALATAVAALPPHQQSTLPAGLATALHLLGQRSPHVSASDALEAQCCEVFHALADPAQRTNAEQQAAHLRLESPHRLESWLVLQVASACSAAPRFVRTEALRAQSETPRFMPPAQRTREYLLHWTEGVSMLPTLFVANRPYAQLLPTGPSLELARRRARLGFHEHARLLLDETAKQAPLPAGWYEALDDLAR